MKLIPLLFALCLITSAIHSQELKEITRNTGNPNYPDKEVYHVLKSDHSILQGGYNKFHNGKLLSSGFYSNGKMDSTWTEYMGSHLIAVKHFSQGAPTGVWEFYNIKDQLEKKYDFSTGEMTDLLDNNKPDSLQKMSLIADETGQLKPALLDRNPQRIMGSAEYLRTLQRSLRYPPEAIDKHEQGTVYVAVTIDENGRAINYSIYKSASPSLDQEAIRVQKLITCDNLPGLLNGQKVKSAFIQTVSFRLEN